MAFIDSSHSIASLEPSNVRYEKADLPCRYLFHAFVMSPELRRPEASVGVISFKDRGRKFARKLEGSLVEASKLSEMEQGWSKRFEGSQQGTKGEGNLEKEELGGPYKDEWHIPYVQVCNVETSLVCRTP